MTGGDAILVRGVYQKEVQFTPSFKLWLCANHRPKVSGEDGAIWRRILTVPFEHVVPEEKRDEAVKLTLRDRAIAGSAILAWAVKGLADLLANGPNGLRPPEAVRAATIQYRFAVEPVSPLASVSRRRRGT